MADPDLVPVPAEQFGAETAAIEAIDAAAAGTDGFSSLGDAARRDLGRPQPGSTGLLIPGRGYGHAWPTRPGAPTPRWELAVTIAPVTERSHLRVLILGSLIDRIADSGGGRVTLWTPGAKIGRAHV